MDINDGNTSHIEKLPVGSHPASRKVARRDGRTEDTRDNFVPGRWVRAETHRDFTSYER